MPEFEFSELVEVEYKRLMHSYHSPVDDVRVVAMINVAEGLIGDNRNLWIAYTEMEDSEIRYTPEGYMYNKKTLFQAYKEINALAPELLKLWKRTLEIIFGADAKV